MLEHINQLKQQLNEIENKIFDAEQMDAAESVLDALQEEWSVLNDIINEEEDMLFMMDDEDIALMMEED